MSIKCQNVMYIQICIIFTFHFAIVKIINFKTKFSSFVQKLYSTKSNIVRRTKKKQNETISLSGKNTIKTNGNDR